MAGSQKEEVPDSEDTALLGLVIERWASWFVPGTPNFNTVRNGEEEYKTQMSQLLAILAPRDRVVPPEVLLRIVTDDLRKFFGMRSRLRSGVSPNELNAEFNLSLRRRLK